MGRAAGGSRGDPPGRHRSLRGDPTVRRRFAGLAGARPTLPVLHLSGVATRPVGTYGKPGCGLSDPWPGRHTLDSDLEALGALIDQRELDRLDLLGMSMGAPVALAYAVRHPERVARLILDGGFASGHEVAS